MGNYRVFDGINWVDPCICNVHVRSITGWQLLDPVNCPVKYWDGKQWCEITCEPPLACIIYSNTIQDYPVNLVTYYCSGTQLGYYVLSTLMYNITDIVDELNMSSSWGDYTDNGDGRIRMLVSPQILAETGCLCENMTMVVSASI